MSLASGVMFCVPFITGALAIGLAYVVLRDRESYTPAQRVLATVGLIAGAANMAFWTVALTHM